MGVDPTVSQHEIWRFQPGEGPRRDLLRDCTTGCGTDGALHSTNYYLVTIQAGEAWPAGVADPVRPVLVVGNRAGEDQQTQLAVVYVHSPPHPHTQRTIAQVTTASVQLTAVISTVMVSQQSCLSTKLCPLQV